MRSDIWNTERPFWRQTYTQQTASSAASTSNTNTLWTPTKSTTSAPSSEISSASDNYQPINRPTNKNKQFFTFTKARVYFVCSPNRKQGVRLCNSFIRNATKHAKASKTKKMDSQIRSETCDHPPFPEAPKDKYGLLQKLININKHSKGMNSKSSLPNASPTQPTRWSSNRCYYTLAYS